MNVFYNVNIYFKLLLYFSLQKFIFSYIKLPFYTYHPSQPNKTTELSYVKYFSENNLYTHLKIGFPPQDIVSILNFNDYPFFIYYNKCEIYSNFNIENSNSYNKNDFQYLLTDIYTYTYLVNDYFYINKDKTFNLTYLFSPVNKDESERKIPKLPYTCANIGLLMSPPDSKSYNYNFIRELKSLNAIKDYVYFIEYNPKNDEQGNLIIGDEPFKYNNNKYKFSQLKEINSFNKDKKFYWNLQFDSIYLNKKEENETEFKIINLKILDSSLIQNLNVILGTNEFMEIIEKEFFNDKIKKKLCQRNRLENNYYNYECLYLKDIQDFPTLYFFHRNLGFTFELNYKELFREYNGNFISLIWIDMNERNTWKLGKPFLKKYIFSFNIDKKKIGFYNTGIEDINEANKKIKKKAYFIYIIVILILLGIMTCICYLFAKKIYFNKKRIINKNITSELMYMADADKE